MATNDQFLTLNQRKRLPGSSRLRHFLLMLLRTLSAATAFLMVPYSQAATKDALPLKRGIYVLRDIPCNKASNADTLSYWGGDNGINDQRSICTIKSQRTRGLKHILSRSCRDIRFNGAYLDSITVDIQSERAFSILRNEYRFCRPFKP